MRNITEHERMFIAGLLFYPELSYQFDDLGRDHFSSDLPWIVYSNIKKKELDDIKNDGLYTVLVDALRNKQFLEGEYSEICDYFGLDKSFVNPYSTEKAYKAIILEYSKRTFMFRHNNLLKKEFHFNEFIEELGEIVEGVKADSSNPDKTYPLSKINTRMIKHTKVRFGIKRLDDTIKVEENNLIIIGSRPFNGKTMFGCFVGMKNTNDMKVLYYSMEMKKEQIADRLKKYGSAFDRDNFIIVEKSQTTISEIKKTAIRTGAGLIIIDQFNKIKGKGKEYEAFTTNARKLKIAAGEMKTPIICLAQANRDAANQRPYAHQLKGSGSLEEEADVVMMLHIEDRDSYTTELYVDKNRTLNGNIGKIPLSFNDEIKQYTEAYSYGI